MLFARTHVYNKGVITFSYKLITNNYFKSAVFCSIIQIHPVKISNLLETLLMRLSIMASLLQTNYTTINVQYDNSRATYTFKISDDMVQQIKKLEATQVIVYTRNVHKVVTIVSIDETPEINTEAEYDYGWVVSVLDTTAHANLIAQEAALIEKLNTAKKQSAAYSAMKALGIEADDEIEKLTRIK